MAQMKAIEVKPGVYWVGGIDWDLRYFHGYLTPRGTTYNAYLIVDEKIVLVDTVKHHLFAEMLSRIEDVIDPAMIDCVVANHVEMDHSGSLPEIMEVVPGAGVITSPQGEKGLRRHYKKEWNFQVVKSGDTVNIGKRNLQFVHTPMVHWPDSMVTYVPEEKLLLPNDAFGQHIASTGRFDDEVGWDIACEEAAKYYANIVLLYGDQVKKALEVVSQLAIDVVAPSHGLIWRSHLPQILAAYRKWADNETDRKALIVYDTMWGSTEKIARALREGLEEAGVPVVTRCLKENHISTVMADALTARAILVGTPTLNNGMFPTVGAFLTYLKGLRPKKRLGFAFGSYGWGGQGVKLVAETLASLEWDMPLDGVNIQYIPDPAELEAVKETGRELAKRI
ncbi:MAG: FprA family A-type flavoprotein [Peptococcaceae bacterium]|nr:MAG: FprA family A-type flavoprotein [Peptococcaceae bacterium]